MSVNTEDVLDPSVYLAALAIERADADSHGETEHVAEVDAEVARVSALLAPPVAVEPSV